MSMPTFPENSTDITRCQAFNMLLGSIAMEELALSHIMNAEGEKLQYFLGTLHEEIRTEATAKEILEVNQSVSTLLENVAHNQYLLKGKLAQVLKAHEQWECIQSPCPCPCKCGKTSVYRASREGMWCAGQRLSWRQMSSDTHTTSIALPRETCFVSFSIELTPAECGKTVIALSSICNGRTTPIMKSSAFAANANETLFISGCTVVTGECDSSLGVSLCEPNKVLVKGAHLTLTLLG